MRNASAVKNKRPTMPLLWSKTNQFCSSQDNTSIRENYTAHGDKAPSRAGVLRRGRDVWLCEDECLARNPYDPLVRPATGRGRQTRNRNISDVFADDRKVAVF